VSWYQKHSLTVGCIKCWPLDDNLPHNGHGQPPESHDPFFIARRYARVVYAVLSVCLSVTSQRVLTKQLNVGSCKHCMIVQGLTLKILAKFWWAHSQQGHQIQGVVG